MKVLGIDTSSSIGSVALVEWVPSDGGAISGAPEILASSTARVSNAHGESLLPLVEATLRHARLDLAAIDLLAVGVGPGSFTGTRIAVATAKGIAIASGKPLRGVDAFAALAFEHAEEETPVVVAIDARKSEVYLSVVCVRGGARRDVEVLAPPIHVRPEHAWSAIVAVCGDAPQVIGDGVSLVPDLARRARPRTGAALVRVVPTAVAVAIVAASRHAREPIDEVDILEPLYVRPPDVTMPTRTPGLPGSPRSPPRTSSTESRK